MERYQHIVRFGLQGHTHSEDFHVTRSIEDNKNIGLNFVTGSLTTYQNSNPGFTVVEIDEEFMVPINFKTYILNITRANLEGKATWELVHDYLQEYDIPDVSPDSLFGLASRFLTDDKVYEKYIYNRGKRYAFPKSAPTEAQKKSKYCDCTTTEFFEKRNCQGKSPYDWQNDPVDALMNMLLNTWVKKGSSTT